MRRFRTRCFDDVRSQTEFGTERTVQHDRAPTSILPRAVLTQDQLTAAGDSPAVLAAPAGPALPSLSRVGLADLTYQPEAGEGSSIEANPGLALTLGNRPRGPVEPPLVPPNRD